jgi:putative peptidoglycan lipid II flippase
MAMLNTLGKFFIPALAPASFNIAVIICAFTMHDYFSQPTVALAVGVLVGGIAQLLVQLWPLFKLGFRYIPTFDLKDYATRRIGFLMAPAALGMAVAEINIFIDTLLASLLPEGSVSYLYYGNRVVQFPLGVFGIAVGIAALPSMSSIVARGKQAQLTDILSHSLRLIFFIAIPSTFGLILLADPITNVLFERGQFDAVARSGTAFAMVFYAIGLVAFSGVKIAASAFYAMKDTKTPTKVASWCMLLNIVLNLLFMGPLKHGGLALATSISSIVNLIMLLQIYRREHKGVDGYKLVKSSLKMTAASALMLVIVYSYITAFFSYEASTFARAGHLIIAVLVGAIVYISTVYYIGSEEAKEIKKQFFK